MKQWYISEISKLIKISKRTLHHYDHIDLLKPSLRGNMGNGYRLYSEDDVSRLQQIIALKTFGFKLSQIKELLNPNIDLLDPLKKQLELLEKKAKAFAEINVVLGEVIANYNVNKNIAWEKVIAQIAKYKDIHISIKK